MLGFQTGLGLWGWTMWRQMDTLSDCWLWTLRTGWEKFEEKQVPLKIWKFESYSKHPWNLASVSKTLFELLSIFYNIWKKYVDGSLRTEIFCSNIFHDPLFWWGFIYGNTWTLHYLMLMWKSEYISGLKLYQWCFDLLQWSSTPISLSQYYFKQHPVGHWGQRWAHA